MKEIPDYSGAPEGAAAMGAAPLPVEETEGGIAFTVASTETGRRLDKVLAERVPRLSRTRLQGWIASGAVLVNGRRPKRARDTLVWRDRIEVTEQPLPEELAFAPADVPVRAVYEDGAILVVDKPAGLVVHPAAGHWNDTLLNGLLARDPLFARLPRAGIVHRLDRDTSGLMVVAKTVEAQLALVSQLASHSVAREYWAIVRGAAPERATIDKPLARDPRHPTRFCVSAAPAAKRAVTHARRVACAASEGKAFSWVACRLETGRTHQIRVHMESEGLPLVGDPVYRGALPALPAGTPLGDLGRQALHASRLGLAHPATGEALSWFTPPPEDMIAALRFLGWGPVDEPVRVFEEGSR